MPRANRYLLPGHSYHLTHRCHDRSFLFRFGRDRREYRRRLRQAVRQFRVTLLAYCITSNHTHLLCRAPEPGIISSFMQWLEGGFTVSPSGRKASPWAMSRLFRGSAGRLATAWSTKFTPMGRVAGHCESRLELTFDFRGQKQALRGYFG